MHSKSFLLNHFNKNKIPFPLSIICTYLFLYMAYYTIDTYHNTKGKTTKNTINKIK